jgi:hypothetical protein
VESVTPTIRFAESAMLVLLNSHALVGMTAVPKTITDDERARLATTIDEESAEVIEQYTSGDELVFELRANVATARAKRRRLRVCAAAGMGGVELKQVRLRDHSAAYRVAAFGVFCLGRSRCRHVLRSFGAIHDD